jgi:hypothetical protein
MSKRRPGRAPTTVMTAPYALWPSGEQGGCKAAIQLGGEGRGGEGEWGIHEKVPAWGWWQGVFGTSQAAGKTTDIAYNKNLAKLRTG